MAATAQRRSWAGSRGCSQRKLWCMRRSRRSVKRAACAPKDPQKPSGGAAPAIASFLMALRSNHKNVPLPQRMEARKFLTNVARNSR